jgi:hypothetical protein
MGVTSSPRSPPPGCSPSPPPIGSAMPSPPPQARHRRVPHHHPHGIRCSVVVWWW